MKFRILLLAGLVLAALAGAIGWQKYVRQHKTPGHKAPPTEKYKPPVVVPEGPHKRPERAEKRDKKNIPIWILKLPYEEQEKTCLSLNVYYEARGEPEEGMQMVAYVTDERKKLRRSYWGKTICENVFMKHSHLKKRGKKKHVKTVCEFSWACQKKMQPNPRNFLLWTKARKVAENQLEGNFIPPQNLKHALYYLRPGRSSRNGKAFFKKLVFLGKVGHHDFYREA